MDEITAYPLAWPAGRPRARQRSRAPFGRRSTDAGGRSAMASLTIEQARTLVSKELDRLGARRPIISTNLRLRNDGFPMSSQAAPADPGVAIYFEVDDGRRCIAIDRWDRVADNFAAVAKSIEALRGLERWGGGQMVTAAFSGFAALPAPGQTSNDVASVDDAAAFISAQQPPDAAITAHDIANNFLRYEIAYRAAVKRHHPDRNGGEPTSDWHKLQSAAVHLNRHFGRPS